MRWLKNRFLLGGMCCVLTVGSSSLMGQAPREDKEKAPGAVDEKSQPASEERRADDRKGEERNAKDRRPEDRRPEDRRPDDRRSDERRPDERRPGFGGPGGFGGGPGGFGGPMMMARLPIMRALDADGDGEISASEIEGAVVALKKLDKNSDGKLTVDELRPEGMPGGPFGGGGLMDGRFNVAEFVANVMQRDANKDGFVDKEESTEVNWRFLVRADADNDGKVSKEEVTKMLAERQTRAGDAPRGAAEEGERPRRPEIEK